MAITSGAKMILTSGDSLMPVALIIEQARVFRMMSVTGSVNGLQLQSGRQQAGSATRQMNMTIGAMASALNPQGVMLTQARAENSNENPR